MLIGRRCLGFVALACAVAIPLGCSEGKGTLSGAASGAAGAAGTGLDRGAGAAGNLGAPGGAAGQGTGGAGNEGGFLPPPTVPRMDYEQYADRDQLDAPPALGAIDTDEEYANRTEIEYLSGRGFDDAIEWQFMCTAGRNRDVWSTIGVPSNWELYGYGSLSYGRETMMTDQGLYRRRFSVPAGWDEKRIWLLFEGAMTDTEVWVNGQSAGPVHQGGFYAFQYDITDLLEPGTENLLEVTVSKHSANESVNLAERKGDYWVFGGIYRPVMLAAVPPQSIARIAADARADGHLRVQARLRGVSEPGELTLRLFDADMSPVGEPVVEAVAAGDEDAVLEADYPGVELWTAETPHRYRVAMELATESGVVHEVRENIGFRSIEVRAGDGIYLNGTRLLLKGINRHSFWPNTGRALSPTLSLYDVRLLKQMNLNAVRSSHYPPDRHFLETCDREGLYVLDELAGWQADYDSQIGPKLVEEMVVHDVNHPSIVFWDNGNEFGWNNTLNDDFAIWDPSGRTVLHPGDTFGLINSSHYLSYDAIVAELLGSTIVLTTEFSHALYDQGGGASLDDYWERIRTSPVGGGGFIWAMLDEGVFVGESGTVDTQGNSAPDGVFGPYRQKEGSFDAIRQIWSPVHVLGQPLDATFSGQLEVENRYQFSTLDDVAFRWQLLDADFATASTTVTAEGTASVAEVAPGTQGTVDLGLPANWTSAAMLRIEALDAGGNVLTRISAMARSAAESSAALVDTASAENAVVTSEDGAEELVVEAASTTYTFARSTARLTGVSRDGQAIGFGNGPTLLPADAGALEAITVTNEGTDVVVAATLGGGLRAVTWRVLGNGWLRLDYELALTGSFDYFGVGFDVPEENVTGAEWLGRGPSRVWKNRLQGPWHGVWQRAPNDAITGEVWEYPEFRGYYDDVHWLRLTTTEGPIHFVLGSDGLAVGLLRPTDARSPLDGPIVYPSTSLSFLHGISPIGTFTLTAAELGPSGQPHAVDGTFAGTVFMHFGETAEVPLR